MTGAGRFCSTCGAPLDPRSGPERKIATLVFADIVGSTELASSLDPEELRRRLGAFFDVARDTLAEFGGTVEKYVGDAVMAAFGVPRAHGDDPDRAIAASLALVERVEALGHGLRVRVGVETGEVLSAPAESDLSVTGEAVNAAARLQQAAAPGEVLVGERAARAARRARLAAPERKDAKGFGSPLVAARATGADGPGRSLVTTPFIGRDDDFDLLRLVYRRAARARVPELVTITGEAGVGKTRLATELVGALRCEEPEPAVVVGRNPPYGRGIAFWALGEIIREAAEVPADAPVEEVRSGLAERLRAAGADDAEPVAGVLAAVLGGEGVQERSLRHSWRRMIGVLAAERPLIVGVDDAHWADDGFLDLVEEAVFQLGEVPLVVICTARPELVERRPGFGRGARNVTTIELRPLAGDAARELATALLPGSAPDLAERVASASGGNPFFAEEVAKIVAEAGNGHADALPDTVQAAIAARLDLLPTPEKSAVQRAAVLGSTFREEALAELVEGSAGELLSRLAAKSLVEERPALGPGRFGFRHQLIRDVAYSTLPKSDRARLHEEAAAGIEQRAGGRAVELAELVSFHLARACELDPSPERVAAAWRSTIAAAELVARRGASARAQELFERAADLAPDAAEKVQALRAASDVAVRQFRGDLGLVLLRREADVAERSGDTRRAASALARGAELATRMGGVTGEVPKAEIQEMIRRGEELADEGDVVTRGRLILDRAFYAWAFGEVADMSAAAEEGLAIARKAGDLALLSSALDAAAAVPWDEGRFREALSLTQERLDLLRSAPEDAGALAVELGDALHMTVATLLQLGDFAEAAKVAREARERDLSSGVIDTGWSREMMSAYYLGEWDRVVEMAELIRAEWGGRVISRSAFAPDMATPGAVLGCRGDAAGAEEWFALAEAMVSDSTARAFEGVRMLRADALIHRGEFADASQLTSEVIEVQWSWWRTSYLATRAEAYVLAERPDAGEAVALAEANTGDNRYARAVTTRARGLRSQDEPDLAAALREFEAIGCAFQAARTGWMLGGARREEAMRAFERLRVPPPAGEPGPG